MFPKVRVSKSELRRSASRTLDAVRYFPRRLRLEVAIEHNMVESAIVDRQALEARHGEKYDVPQNARSKNTSTPQHHAPQLPPLNLSSSRSLGWPQRLAQTYIMELRELVRLNSVAAQLIKHCSSPPLSEGPRGPMVSYCGTLTGFHSAPSQPIVSRRREHALDVLEREHGAGNVSHQILRFGPFSKVLPSPPTAFRHLRGAEASGPWPASPLYATLSERNKLLINAK